MLLFIGVVVLMLVVCVFGVGCVEEVWLFGWYSVIFVCGVVVVYGLFVFVLCLFIIGGYMLNFVVVVVVMLFVVIVVCYYVFDVL